MPYDIEYLTNLAQIASAVVAIVALFFSGISIYLTKKSIESANRPDIIPYVATLEIHETAYYFVLKNFGAFVSTPCVRVMPDENTFDAKAYLVNGLIEFEERLL